MAWSAALLATLGSGAPARAADRVPASPMLPTAERAAEYRAEAAKTIIELQQFRHVAAAAIDLPNGARGTATLVNLNPAINAWFLLTIAAGERASFHLENPAPTSRKVALSSDGTLRLVITDPSGEHSCAPWRGAPSALELARRSARPYAPICDGLLYLRNATRGHRTGLERVTDFLRDDTWGGETIVGLVREKVYRDAFVERPAPDAAASGAAPQPPGAPQAALVDATRRDLMVQPGSLAIAVDGSASGAMHLGAWYPATGLPDIYVSVIRPDAIAQPASSGDRAAARLDAVEAAALDFLVAFDLARFDLGFALGTEHPRLGWSPRTPAALLDQARPGPDGIGSAAPLIATGLVSPALAGMTVASFTGGFKREHSAFKYGPLSLTNHANHYGFVEEGVVLSKLQPGLATLFVLADGSVRMKTWTEQDAAMLGQVRHARQNGVALVEPDAATGKPLPGAFVAQWGPGNWSGSAEGALRSLRAGACLAERDGRSFLIYGYFSTATPSAMAQVFQAYGCGYAMLLDMNALEHTYLALYLRRHDTLMIEHLVKGMAQVDKVVDGRVLPRFLAQPDNRDFFYLTRRQTTK